MENPMKLDDLRVPLFQEATIFGCLSYDFETICLLWPGIRDFAMYSGRSWRSLIFPVGWLRCALSQWLQTLMAFPPQSEMGSFLDQYMNQLFITTCIIMVWSKIMTYSILQTNGTVRNPQHMAKQCKPSCFHHRAGHAFASVFVVPRKLFSQVLITMKSISLYPHHVTIHCV